MCDLIYRKSQCQSGFYFYRVVNLIYFDPVTKLTNIVVLICLRNFLQLIRRRVVFSRHGGCILRRHIWPGPQLIYASRRINMGGKKRQETPPGEPIMLQYITQIDSGKTILSSFMFIINLRGIFDASQQSDLFLSPFLYVLRFNPWLGHNVVFLDNALYSHIASLLLI